jgi:hypothetical protein
MVLVMAPGDGQPEPSAEEPLPRGVLVIAVEADGRRIVVEFVEGDAKFTDGAGGDVEHQRGNVGVEEAIEGTAGAVVVEGGELVVREAEPVGVVSRGPFTDAIERLTGNEQVAHEQEQGGGRGDAGPAILAGEAFCEELVDVEPLEEAADHGQGADLPGLKRVAAGACGLAGLSWVAVLAHVGSFSEDFVRRTS